MAKSTRQKPEVAKPTTGLVLLAPVESLNQLVDRLGHVQAQLDANALQMAPLVAQQKLLSTKLLSRYESLPADEVAIAEGDRYTVKIGAKADEQSVVSGGLKQVFKWVGADRFIERAKLTFEQLKGLLTAEQYAEVVKKARTGRRSLVIVPKVAMELPPAA